MSGPLERLPPLARKELRSRSTIGSRTLPGPVHWKCHHSESRWSWWATGVDAEYLAGLPLEMLPLGEKALKQLRLLGVRDLGEFAALPENTVRTNYGEEGWAGGQYFASLGPIRPSSFRLKGG